MTNTERFKQLVSEMADTYERKNSDYGNSFDATLDKWGPNIALARLEDKLNRATTILSKPAKVEESIKDTLLDLSTYALMLQMWLEKQKSTPESPKIEDTKKDIAATLFVKYGGKEIPAMKGLNQKGYSPTLVLGTGTVVGMDIKNGNLHVKYTGLNRNGRTVGSGTMDALYPLDDLNTYGFTL